MVPDETADELRIAERLPFVVELTRRIDSISSAIDRGESGITQTLNLLSDLPPDWDTDIGEPIKQQEMKYTEQIKEYQIILGKGTRKSEKEDALYNKKLAGQEYSRQVKRIVVNLLYKKGLLFLTKKAVEQGHLSLYEDEQEE